MGNWNDRELWNGLIDGSRCPVCQRGKPLSIIAENKSSWLTMPIEESAMKGYVCLVSKIHAVELFDLTDQQSSDFMSDVKAVGKAVSKATECVKINYEVHGNILPHLHMHFFPRFPGDPFEGRKIDFSILTEPVYGESEIQQTKEAILSHLEF